MSSCNFKLSGGNLAKSYYTGHDYICDQFRFEICRRTTQVLLGAMHAQSSFTIENWLQQQAKKQRIQGPFFSLFCLLVTSYSCSTGSCALPIVFRRLSIYLLLAQCEVRTASYGPSFFLPFMAQARSA